MGGEVLVQVDRHGVQGHHHHQQAPGKFQDMGEVPWEEWLADVSWLANEC